MPKLGAGSASHASAREESWNGELTHDIGAMRLGGFGANVQCRAYLFRGLPLGYQASDFQLAMSEKFSKR
jgi:hypothetical protein